MSDSPTPADLMRINLALMVLHEVVPSSNHQSIDKTEVRLALWVLGPYVPKTDLVEFWSVGVDEPKRPWNTCITPYTKIVKQLRDRGIALRDEVIPFTLRQPTP